MKSREAGAKDSVLKLIIQIGKCRKHSVRNQSISGIFCQSVFGCAEGAQGGVGCSVVSKAPGWCGLFGCAEGALGGVGLFGCAKSVGGQIPGRNAGPQLEKPCGLSSLCGCRRIQAKNRMLSGEQAPQSAFDFSSVPGL